MDRRLMLQEKLEELLGSRAVYYKSPPNNMMEYPCIRYKKEKIRDIKANNSSYISHYMYQIIVISKTQDHPVIEKLLKLQSCIHVRQYIADNLYHDVLNIYF